MEAGLGIWLFWRTLSLNEAKQQEELTVVKGLPLEQ